MPGLQAAMAVLGAVVELLCFAVCCNDLVADRAVARAIAVPAISARSEELNEAGAFLAEGDAELFELLTLKISYRIVVDQANDGADGVFVVLNFKRFNAGAVNVKLSFAETL